MKDHIHSINLLAEKALKKAIANVIADYKARGQLLAVWQDGKVVHVPAGRSTKPTKSRPSKKR